MEAGAWQPTEGGKSLLAVHLTEDCYLDYKGQKKKKKPN